MFLASSAAPFALGALQTLIGYIYPREVPLLRRYTSRLPWFWPPEMTRSSGRHISGPESRRHKPGEGRGGLLCCFGGFTRGKKLRAVERDEAPGTPDAVECPPFPGTWREGRGTGCKVPKSHQRQVGLECRATRPAGDSGAGTGLSCRAQACRVQSHLGSPCEWTWPIRT